MLSSVHAALHAAYVPDTDAEGEELAPCIS